MLEAKRVVVTGMGVVTPLGVGLEPVWAQLLAGVSGAGPITHFDASIFPCQIACEVPTQGGNKFDINDWVDRREQRRLDLFVVYAVAAAQMALDDSGWRPQSDEEKNRAGTAMSSGIGGLATIEDGVEDLRKKGKMSPFFVPKLLINMASGQVSIREGLRGPNIAPVTACATGVHAIGDAMRIIARDEADVMVAGGAEAAITAIGIGGFCACHAMATHFNQSPQSGSRPYDKDREGFVMGEGAGAVVLESLEHAQARGARIYAEIVGYGMSGDAHHITAPSGDGAVRAMQAAIKDARITPEQIDYINAHGTSTPMGDEVEINAIEKVFDGSASNLSVSSTKSSTGHLLGAAGAIEAIFSILAARDNKIPPTINLENCDVDTKIDLVPLKMREKNINTVMSNSFGFGGTNASLICKLLT